MQQLLRRRGRMSKTWTPYFLKFEVIKRWFFKLANTTFYARIIFHCFKLIDIQSKTFLRQISLKIIQKSRSVLKNYWSKRLSFAFFKESLPLFPLQRAVAEYYTLHISGTTTDPAAFTSAEDNRTLTTQGEETDICIFWNYISSKAKLNYIPNRILSSFHVKRLQNTAKCYNVESFYITRIFYYVTS